MSKKNDLKEALNELGVEFDENAKVPELEDVLDKAQAEDIERKKVADAKEEVVGEVAEEIAEVVAGKPGKDRHSRVCELNGRIYDEYIRPDGSKYLEPKE